MKETSLRYSVPSGENAKEESLRYSVPSGENAKEESLRYSVPSGENAKEESLRYSVPSGENAKEESLRYSVPSGENAKEESLRYSVPSGENAKEESLRSSVLSEHLEILAASVTPRYGSLHRSSRCRNQPPVSYDQSFHLSPRLCPSTAACLPLSSIFCFPVPGGSLLLCYVVVPSSTSTLSCHLLLESCR